MGLSRGDAYEVLELPIGADNDSIRTSYKRLAQKWHPEKHHNSPDSLQKFRQVSHAYRRLITDSQTEMDTKEMLKQFKDLFFTKPTKTVNGRHSYSTDEDSSDVDDSDDDEDQYCNVAHDRCKHRHDIPNSKKSPRNTTYLSPEDIQKNAEELVTEEDKEKKKNDRKKAKKKRRKERKRLEKEKQDDKGKSKKSNGKKNDRTGSSSDSSSDEGTGFESHPAFFTKVINKKKKGSAPETTQTNKKDKKTKDSQQSTKSEEEVEGLDPIVLRSRQLAIRGNEMAQLEYYSAAIELFTEAIKLDPKDFRFFGNRSYCFDRMQQYDKALKDAEKAISLCKDWPKGYFRKGRALAGLKLYPDAEKAFMQVLKLDKNCEEAVQELLRVRTYQLTEMGFTKQQAEGAIKKYGSVQTALDSLLAGMAESALSGEVYLSDDDEPVTRKASPPLITHYPVQIQQSDVKMDPRNVEGLTALWVGNVLPQVSEKKLMQMFSRYGPVTSVRLLPEKYCAFVNYKTKEAAGKAMHGLQGEECEGQKLLVRFPDHPISNGHTTLRKSQPQIQQQQQQQQQPVQPTIPTKQGRAGHHRGSRGSGYGTYPNKAVR
ncbi:hypothetical protein SNE40_007916 [Patella caerulea]|uniref:Uncharacterized protein n=1 Tax=Patella caerulea TaxID=87958 RepID=A0AAN8K022_PATCE